MSQGQFPEPPSKLEEASANGRPKWRLWTLLYVVAPIFVVLAWAARFSGVADEFTFVFPLSIPSSGACTQMISRCTLANEELRASYFDIDACDQAGALVCLIPMGDVPPGVIERIAAGIEAEGTLDAVVLPPIDVPIGAYNSERNQFEAGELLDDVAKVYQRNKIHQGNLLIVITPVDIYTEARPRWRFAFGQRQRPPIGLPIAIVSTYRMAEGRPSTGSRTLSAVEGEREASRLQKLVNKYIGLDYYGLPPSDDPHSAMYDDIVSVSDLDRMPDRLPIPR